MCTVDPELSGMNSLFAAFFFALQRLKPAVSWFVESNGGLLRCISPKVNGSGAYALNVSVDSLRPPIPSPNASLEMISFEQYTGGLRLDSPDSYAPASATDSGEVNGLAAPNTAQANFAITLFASVIGGAIGGAAIITGVMYVFCARFVRECFESARGCLNKADIFFMVQ
jgi:hypothetical protein